MSCAGKKIWDKIGIEGPVVVYPDIFNSFAADVREQELCPSLPSLCADISNVDQFEAILAAIPLLKALGGVVTRSLDERVTFILCNLSEHRSFEWSWLAPTSIYTDPCRGLKIHNELRKMAMRKNPLLITAEWVHEQWKDTYG